jgi:hypothetical protein
MPRHLFLMTTVLIAACSQSPYVPHGDGAPPGDGSGPRDMAASGGCPTVALSTTLPITYQGDTTGKQNLVSSARLEWGDAPDDALLFVAPATGSYTIALTAPCSNCNFGVSAQDYSSMSVYNESSCPAAGTVGMLDGIFDGSLGAPGMLTLDQGQHALLWVSATTFSAVQAGPYTVTITKN